jgi:integrase/recombinase XerD
VIDDLYRAPAFIERARHSWLRQVIDGFLADLAAQRYSKGSLRFHCSRLLALSEFMAGKGVREVNQLPQWVGPFVAQAHITDYSCRKWQLLFARFISYLQQNKFIPPPASPTPSATTLLVDDYIQYLRDLRGLSGGWLAASRQLCQSLLTFMAAESVDHFHAVGPDLIHRFIVSQGRQCTRETLSGRCSVLRNFLSFLRRRRIISVDLAAVVVRPRLYQHERCPRFLTRPEIESVLVAIDRSTALGRRNHAMILLLAVYGLRGGEVIRLRLNDIDWRNQILHIRRRKAGNNSTYPLSSEVGEAIVAYLQQGRPTSPLREVFLRTCAPFTRLASSASLNFWVKRYVARSGIRVARPGTHSFRYSCAQRLFEQGMPIKSIGDFLGHRGTVTTQRYTKIALEQLREVASGDGEELLCPLL